MVVIIGTGHAYQRYGLKCTNNEKDKTSKLWIFSPETVYKNIRCIEVEQPSGVTCMVPVVVVMAV